LLFPQKKIKIAAVGRIGFSAKTGEAAGGRLETAYSSFFFAALSFIEATEPKRNDLDLRFEPSSKTNLQNSLASPFSPR
jgi:hypothetical protein